MKTNVSIELTDSQRDVIANRLDGKTTKRLATRSDINKLCSIFIEAMADEAEQTNQHPVAQASTPNYRDLTTPDPEDRERLAGMHPDYIRGWNKAKHRLGATE